MIPGASSDWLPDREFCLAVGPPQKVAVCIPACNEDSLLPVIQSLLSCTPIEDLLICVVINASAEAPDTHHQQNIRTYESLLEFIKTHKPDMAFHVALYNRLPPKKSGVGMARKLAMDKACSLMQSTSSDTLLLCLDADCTVEENYLQAVRWYFEAHPKIVAASIYFEHPMPENTKLSQSITSYELHLRYLKNALQWCGYPWYFHTVGSSMALRAKTYLANGGMNTRKAGEDFYFLHKLMPLGFGEINTTTVFPEARYSDRVPFGTGRSMLELQGAGLKLTYNFQSFEVLRHFFASLKVTGQYHGSMDLHPLLQTYFDSEGLHNAWNSSLANSRTPDKALQRFYSWFSGFRIIHCLHYLRAGGFEDQPVDGEARKLAGALGNVPKDNILAYYRHLDRTNNPAIAGLS